MPNQNQETEKRSFKAARYLKSRGLKEFSAHAAEKIREGRFDYQKWVLSNEPSSAQVGYQKKLLMPIMPNVYVMVLRPDGESVQEKTVESVAAQTFRNVHTAEILTSHMEDDSYVLCIADGDLLTKDAVFRMVEALQDASDAVYADSDACLCEDGRMLFSGPLFKPDYNPDYLRSCNYIGTPFMVRTGVIRSEYRTSDGEEAVPGSHSLSDPAAYYAYVLRCCRAANQGGGVKHVPKILCHRMQAEQADAGALAGERAEAMRGAAAGTGDVDRAEAMRGAAAGTGDVERAEAMRDAEACAGDMERRAMRDAVAREIARENLRASVSDGPLPETFCVRYEVTGSPLVSIIIPNKDNYSVLENCLWSIRNRSTYPAYEILIVENNSTQNETLRYYEKLEEEKSARIIRYEHPFHFSRICNEGVKQARGEYVILMNNDVTVCTPDWIERLLGHCQRPGIGAAGPKLLYPDGRVQSCGIVTGLMGFAGSMMVLSDGSDPGYMGRGCLTQDMSALTAACMMVKRSVYLECGGMAEDLPVALNDVDFCLRLVEEGYRNVLEPSALMVHHESLTRGQEDSPEKKKRFEKEKRVFRRRWAKWLRDGDPAYNPNLSRRKCDWSQQT